MSPLIVSIAVFVAVTALIAAATSFLRSDSDTKIEDRLQVLTGNGPARTTKEASKSLLMQPLDAAPGIVEAILERFGKSKLLFQQADTSITPSQFGMITGGLAVAGVLLAGIAGLNVLLLPLAAGMLAAVPLMWLLWKRKRRLKAFAVQLPDALDLISRALRAGHSLAAGFDLVQKEMNEPICVEFGRVFEEQNLGLAMEEALEGLTERVPNLDLKFFSTAVILQRTTGGDLAEILDKIGYIVRERFKIYGQVQALTGEGRLSGIVLLALPPVLFVVVFRLNPGYIMMLFNDPMGTKMLVGAVIMQIFGALVIRKIINIKV
ncbi:MAG TPA: type II secretion system F family protein [Pirellulales bacterium]|jgi:tight adherence protein B|nr:type II secretion system F family protein [Pirellulales bacterium]